MCFVWMFCVCSFTECHLATIISPIPAGLELAAKYRWLLMLCNYGFTGSFLACGPQFLPNFRQKAEGPVRSSWLQNGCCIGYCIFNIMSSQLWFFSLPLTNVQPCVHPFGSETMTHHIGMCCCRELQCIACLLSFSSWQSSVLASLISRSLLFLETAIYSG